MRRSDGPACRRAGSTGAYADAETDEDPFAAFRAECLEDSDDPNDFVVPKAMLAAYEKWAGAYPDRAEWPLQPQQFSRQLKKATGLLIRGKRVADAELRAALPENEVRINELYSLRDTGVWQVHTVTNQDGIDCSRFERPLDLTSSINLPAGDSPAARWFSIVNRGGKLHYWPPHKYIAAANSHADALRQQVTTQREEFVRLNHAIDAGFGG
ncbi:MAG: hypothetical protein WCB92_35240 [Mycobacterium sp.]